MRVVRTRRGARLTEAGTVLSEILREPGPSHTLFDVLAAAIAALAPGPRVALLGFAGGGLVAPLRAMGFEHPLDAVDLSLDGARVFRELSAGWAGTVRIRKGEASAWIRGRSGAYDLILEDLFLDGPRGMAKPEVSMTVLPSLVARAVGGKGIAVVNILPVPGEPWRDVVARLTAPWPERRVVRLDEYENRLAICGRSLGTAREVSARLRAELRRIGSRQARRIAVEAA
jgi:hypothetical protein